jgi:hypothetical protein
MYFVTRPAPVVEMVVPEILPAGDVLSGEVPPVAAKVTAYAPDVAGTDKIDPVTVAVSEAPVATEEKTTFAVAAEPPTVAVEATTEVPSAAFTSESANMPAAFAETAENPPRVSATAATAAMRLMLVFVDIIFLSEKVDLENFSISAWPDRSTS